MKQHKFNIYSQLFGYDSKKIFYCERSSTLPPHGAYMLSIQRVRKGGIRGGIRVEFHVITP